MDVSSSIPSSYRQASNAVYRQSDKTDRPDAATEQAMIKKYRRLRARESGVGGALGGAIFGAGIGWISALYTLFKEDGFTPEPHEKHVLKTGLIGTGAGALSGAVIGYGLGAFVGDLNAHTQVVEKDIPNLTDTRQRYYGMPPMMSPMMSPMIIPLIV